MRISQISYNYNKPVSFKSNERETKNENGEVINRNKTSFFRNDIGPWDNFANFIINKYKNIDKVNVCCYACSDGSEPVSLAVILSELAGRNASKFFPIIAKDRDRVILEFAKSGSIQAYIDDIQMINCFTKGNLPKYFDIRLNDNSTFQLGVKNNIKDNIHYELADISDDVYKIPKENTILMCRNFWPYLDSKREQARLIENISRRLGENSLIVIGSFDLESNVDNELLAAGFSETRIPFVYESPQKPSNFYI